MAIFVLVIELCIVVAWLYVVAISVWEGIQVSMLPAEDKPRSDAWVVFALALGGMLSGALVTVIGWGVKRYVYAPLDIDTDTVGTVRLYMAADTIFQFVFMLFALGFALFAVVFGLLCMDMGMR